MKTTKTIYFITTGLVSLMMAYSALTYLFQPAMAHTFQHLGYPAYFRVELAIAKLIGVFLLIAPVCRRLRDLAYAGFAFVFISASIAHICSGDPMPYPLIPLVFLAILIASYVSMNKYLPLHKS